MVISRNDPVVIVGAGCFGISTAYHLLQRGFTDVTVLDRSERLPAPDAASTDLNKSERTCPSSSHFSKNNLTIKPLATRPFAIDKKSRAHVLFRHILYATCSGCCPRVEEDR